MSPIFPKMLPLLEDNSGDANAISNKVDERESISMQLTQVESVTNVEIPLAKQAVDVIPLDLKSGGAQRSETIGGVHAASPGVPLVGLAGLHDESLMHASRTSAQDYVIPSQVDGRGPLCAVRYFIGRKIMEIAAAFATGRRIVCCSERDFLTSLPNRMLLSDRIGRAIALAERHERKVAVLVLDLDGFKYINDALGHPVGDRLLQSVARRLKACMRNSDSVSRQGGDEFVVLLLDLQQTQDAIVAARRILEAVAQSHSIDLYDLHVTASAGVSIYPDDGLDADTLIKNADTAMYQAKGSGRRRVQRFKPAMNVRAVERQFLEEGLRRALERREFALHYQPKVNLMSGTITGAEALLRWTHPTRGSITPAQFIPVAEDSGLILPIGTWVLREACRQARAWVDAGLPLRTMSVNVSAMQFRDKNFLEGLFAILTDTGLDPSAFELELTETVLMKHAVSTAAILQALRKRGVQIAVDDFGTGYSSLSYLQKLPIDAVKIDQSFVRQISTAGDDTTIVKAIIGMTRGLKLRVIAEGVETSEEAAFLRAYRCEEAQGYYFSRPIPSQQFAELLKNGIQESAIGA
jgi:diguanylate cyclase (GGDEF)-like protein